jgi:DNA anti-recombination protein RmuC
MNEIYISIAGFLLTAFVVAITTTWSLARMKEQLSNENEATEKRLIERISTLEKENIRLEATANLNKERIERIQGIFELKLDSINELIKQLERKINSVRAEIDKRLTLRKQND